jgi:hypothetical protein
MTLHWLKILAVFALWVSETALAQIVDPVELAKAFNYPAEKLRVSDITQKARDKHGETIVLAFSISGEGRTFAPTTVVVAREGSLLTEKLRHKIAQIMEQLDVPPSGRKSVKKFEMANGAVGYVGMGAFGPGGGEEMAIANIPSQRVDVQMKVTVPYETPLDVTDATRAYHDALVNTDGFLAAALEDGMKAVAVRIAQGNALVSEQAPTNATSTLIAPEVTTKPAANIAPPPEPVVPPSTPPAVIASSPAKSTNPLWWIAGAVTALVALVLVVRSKKPKA